MRSSYYPQAGSNTPLPRCATTRTVVPKRILIKRSAPFDRSQLFIIEVPRYIIMMIAKDVLSIGVLLTELNFNTRFQYSFSDVQAMFSDSVGDTYKLSHNIILSLH